VITAEQLEYFNANAFIGRDRHGELLVGSIGPAQAISIDEPGELCWPFAHQPELYWAWFNHPNARRYESVYFKPRKADGGRELNLWTPYATPTKNGTCQEFKIELRDSVCDGDSDVYRRLVAWIDDAVVADTVSDPLLVIYNGGMLERELRALFAGRMTCFPLDRWTGHRRFVWVDDAHRFARELITEATQEHVRNRFYSGPQYQRFIATTREPWIHPVGFVVKDTEVDRTIAEQMDSGGRSDFVRYLLTRDR